MTTPTIAYHEAGHAVVALAFGWRICSVTVDPTRTTMDGWLGECHYTMPDDEQPAIQRAAVSLAGQVSEARLAALGKQQDIWKDDGTLRICYGDLIVDNDFLWSASCEEDFTTAIDILGILLPLHREQPELLAAVHLAAGEITQHWQTVRRIAADLLGFQTIENIEPSELIAIGQRG